jgi:hypothetical protein
LQDGQQVMNPIVGLGLAQIELQAMQSLQRIGLLKDKYEQQFVFHRIFTRVTFLYLIVNKRVKCDFAGNPSGYKPLTMEKSGT